MDPKTQKGTLFASSPFKPSSPFKQTLFEKEHSAILFTLILILVISLVTGGIYYYTQQLSIAPKSIAANISTPNIPTPTIIAAESSVSAIPKTAELNYQIKIQVLNGSGISGQAGKFKGQLSDLGFKSIEVGNTDNTLSEASMSATAKVDQKTLDAITTLLRKAFPKIKPIIDPSQKTFDVIISTGKS